MKILLVSESFYPMVSGVAVMTERFAACLAARGHQVSVMAPSLNRSFHKEKRTKFTIYRIPSWRNPFRNGFRFTFWPGKYTRLVINEVKPEIIHVQDPASLAWSSVLLARKRGIPSVATNHFALDYILTYLPWLKPLHPVLRWLFRHYLFVFYNRNQALTVPTETVKRMLQTKRGLKLPIEVISNGVDIGRFSLYYASDQLIKKYRISPGLPLILYVGRLDPEKNVSGLLKSLAQVKQPFQAVLLGSGNCQEELKQEALTLGIGKKIIWIKGINNQSSLLNQLYHLARFFCLPSYTETESMVTMEAMASGLPVIASRVGALPELVEDGVNGFLLDPDNSATWAAKIAYLLENESERQKMARKSLEKITSRDLGDTIRKFEKLYRDLLESRPKGF